MGHMGISYSSFIAVVVAKPENHAKSGEEQQLHGYLSGRLVMLKGEDVGYKFFYVTSARLRRLFLYCSRAGRYDNLCRKEGTRRLFVYPQYYYIYRNIG
jgi:hypothetical protein